MAICLWASETAMTIYPAPTLQDGPLSEHDNDDEEGEQEDDNNPVPAAALQDGPLVLFFPLSLQL